MASCRDHHILKRA